MTQKFVPPILPGQSDAEYEKLLDSMGITDDDFNEWFDNLIPVTDTKMDSSVASADDTALDNDEDADFDNTPDPETVGFASLFPPAEEPE